MGLALGLLTIGIVILFWILIFNTTTTTVPSKHTKQSLSAFVASLEVWNTHENLPALQDRADYIKERGFILLWAEKPLLEAIYELERPFRGDVSSIERRKIRIERINHIIALVRADLRDEEPDYKLRWPYSAQDDYTSV